MRQIIKVRDLFPTALQPGKYTVESSAFGQSFLLYHSMMEDRRKKQLMPAHVREPTLTVALVGYESKLDQGPCDLVTS